MIEKFRTDLLNRGASTNTVETYIRNVKLFVSWYEQTTGTPFDNRITVFDAREYRGYLITVKKQKPASVNAKLTAVQQYANFLYSNGLQEKIKVEKQKAVSMHRVRVLDRNTLYKCRRWAHSYAGIRDAAIFELFLNTGIRESELAALELGDVQIGERKGSLVVRNGKGRKFRELPLNKDARNAIQEYLSLRPISDSQRIFLGQRGPLTRTAIYKIIQRIGEKGSGAELTPHMLRHQCLTAMAKSGVDLSTIADLAGHSDVKLTAQYYIATSEDDRQNAVDKLVF